MELLLAVLALLVSMAALAVAIKASRDTGRQARAAEEANRLAEQRRHDDIAPTFTLSLREDSEEHVRLLLELVPGHVDLDGLAVEVIDDGNLDGALVGFTPDQNGVAPGQQRPRRRATWPGLLRGERAIWRVQLPQPPRASRLRLRVTSRAGAQEWTAVVETGVPHGRGVLTL
ncbi:hypothetical protein FHN55_16730 [Streptomyces sp. NP160]|uniref:hypothetical protein n=1 Tax=Streptomyces sp. NP160 TaxID=2586637 RepID=UPI001119B3C2|nr:hypothetical protein [Streptomyces sp. NP160]TNM61954.1 hypothetical protein FHN55_16730 [Streptomyces sp. NP160]